MVILKHCFSIFRLSGLFLLLLICSCQQYNRPSSSTGEIQASETKFGAGDIFDVRVFGEKDLTNTYRVAHDGSIDFPLVGRVTVQGLEPPQVADHIALKLQKGGFIREPQVSIFVKQYDSKKYSVVGAVKKPGTFAITPGVTVVQAISMAGGFTALSSKNDVVVTRKNSKQISRFKVPVERVTEGTEDDFLIQAGDIIYVPERVF